MRPKATLNPKQLAALAALLDGESVQDTAKRARVHRSTLSKWLREGEPLALAFAEECAAIRDIARNQSLAAASTALATLRAAIEAGSWRAADSLLRGVGALDSKATLDVRAPSGPMVVIHLPDNGRDPLTQEGREQAGGNARQ